MRTLPEKNSLKQHTAAHDPKRNGATGSRGRLKVAVVSTVLNQLGSVRDYVDAIQCQVREPDEVIVVDGGSTDGTPEKLKELFPPRIPLKVMSIPGVNIAAGRNKAIEESTAEIIATTDFGCRPEREWLKHLIAPFERDGHVDFIAGVTLPDPRTEFEECSGKTTLYLPEDHHSDIFIPTGRNSAYRRDVWSRVGGYPEELYCGEDSLFSQKAKNAGFAFELADDAVVYWRPRSSFSKVAKQFYLYALGTGRAGFSRQTNMLLLKCALFAATLVVLLVFFYHPVFLVLFLLAGIAYAVKFYGLFKSRYRLSGPKKALITFLLLRTQNAAVISGYCVGIFQHFFHPRYRSLGRSARVAGGNHRRI